MSTTAPNVARRIVADALRLNWSGLEVRFALRCTVGIAIPLIAAIAGGQPLAGVSAAYGALVTGLASRQGHYRTRVGAMLAASAALAVSAFAGALTGSVPVLNIVLFVRLVARVRRHQLARTSGDRRRGERVRGLRRVLERTLRHGQPGLSSADGVRWRRVADAAARAGVAAGRLSAPNARRSPEPTARSPSTPAGCAPTISACRTRSRSRRSAPRSPIRSRSAAGRKSRRFKRWPTKSSVCARRSRRSRPNSICSTTSA